MAEYLDATPARRATIVRQQKAGSGHPAQYYALAQTAMSRTLVSNDPASAFKKEFAKIASHQGWGNHPRQLITNNLQAFQGLMNASGAVISSPGSFRMPSAPLDPRQYGDVRVSNRIDVELVIGSKRPHYGGIKYYLNKEHPLSDFSGAVLTSMLYEAMSEVVGENAISRSSIIVIDAFHGRIFRPPTQIKRHLKEAVAASQEFSMHWEFMGNF